MRDLSTRIKHLRENLKDENSIWTQSYVAKQIGVARVTYTAYENGTKTPPPDMVKKIANLFNVSTDYLLGNSEQKNLPNNEEIDPELQKFMDEVKVWYKNEPKDKQEKLKMMRKMFEVFKED